MFRKAFPVQVGIPETLYRIRYGGIYTVVIGQDAVGPVRGFREDVPCPVHMRPEFFFFKVFQVAVREGGNHPHRLFNTVKIGVQVLLSGLTQEMKRPFRVIFSHAANGQGSQQRRNDDGNHH